MAAVLAEPGYASTLFNLGILQITREDLVGAEERIYAAVRAGSRDADALSNPGFLQERRGDLAGAEARYVAAELAAPGYASTLSNRGRLQEKRRRAICRRGGRRRVTQTSSPTSASS